MSWADRKRKRFFPIHKHNSREIKTGETRGAVREETPLFPAPIRVKVANT